jgi:hypothetical protein
MRCALASQAASRRRLLGCIHDRLKAEAWRDVAARRAAAFVDGCAPGGGTVELRGEARSKARAAGPCRCRKAEHGRHVAAALAAIAALAVAPAAAANGADLLRERVQSGQRPFLIRSGQPFLVLGGALLEALALGSGAVKGAAALPELSRALTQPAAAWEAA